MPDTFVKIATVTVGSGGAATIDFSSIPSTYTDLCLFTSLRSTSGGTADAYYSYASFNGVSTNRTFRKLQGDGSGVSSNNGTNPVIGVNGGTGGTASTFTNGATYIPNYTSSNYKSYSSDTVSERNSTTANSLDLTAGLWSSTSAINQITVTTDTGNLAEYSTATLYGISKS